MWVWAFASAALARMWRATGLWLEADALDGFAWAPLGLAADALFAALLAFVVWCVVRRPRSAAAVGAVLGLAHIAWLALNLVSFALTQAPVTFQRARGDEGVKLEAHELLRWEDVLPAVSFAVVALAVLPVAVFLSRFLVRVLTRGMVAMGLGGALLCYSADALFFRDENFGVADHVGFTLASSYVEGFLEEDRRPVLQDGATQDRTALLAARHARRETAPPPRARAELKNVVVILAEGVSYKHTSLGGADSTPHLLRRARESGLEFTRYYAPYHKSIAGIFSTVCASFPPPNGQSIAELNGRIDCGEWSDVLAAHAIHSGVFHGGDFGFYDKLMLLGMRHYDVLEDARRMSDPLVWEENRWGIDDRAVVDHFLEWVDSLPPGDRFGGLLIPITAHWPFWIPSDVEPRYPAINSKNKYLSAVHFLDETFERLMQGLEARGLDRDTAVIFVADHGETVGERPRASAGRRLAYEPSLHVPAVILAPGMWPGSATSDRLSSHADLLPTVLDLMGLPADPRHEGRSLLEPDREPQRIFIGASNGPRSVGFLDGDRKFIVNRTTGQREAYDLTRDPDERHNLIEELPEDEVARVEQDALAFADAHLEALRRAPRIADELDVEGAFVAAAEVRVRRGDEVISCRRAEGNAAGAQVCPGLALEVFAGRQVVDARGRHDCLLVRPPPDGVLEIEVRGQPWLPFLARLRVAQTSPQREHGLDVVPVEVWSDGQLEVRRMVLPDASPRLSFAYPRERLMLRVGGDGPTRRDTCLALTDRGWRNRPAAADTPALESAGTALSPTLSPTLPLDTVEAHAPAEDH